MIAQIPINLLDAEKFQYKSTSYKMQNLYIKSLDIDLEIARKKNSRSRR